MRFFEKYKKKCISYAKTAGITALFLIVAVPFTKKLVADSRFTPGERFMVVLNGEELGYVNDEKIANEALVAARTEIMANTDGLSLVTAEIEIMPDKNGGTVLSKDELAVSMYDVLASDVFDTDKEHIAYTVRIDDITVTLPSKDAVTRLLEKVKNKFSNSAGFSLEIVEDKTKPYDSYTARFVSGEASVNEAAKVLAGSNSSANSANKKNIKYKDGVLSVNFAQKIEVIPTKITDSVITVDEAYELLTKEHSEKETYKVVQGDCLSGIAKKCGITMKELFALNYGYDEDTPIYPGDILTITVPTADISVVVKEEKTYKEKYNAEVKYVNNNSMYAGTENVIQAGSSGTRTVVALITKVNGVETQREILKQSISKKAVPRIIERGTLTPPTYIMPVFCDYVTSPFGYRDDVPGSTYHNGVDWGASYGSSIRAARGGTVIGAGWNGAYGLCVDIDHGDGVTTKYAHMSDIYVNYGDYVRQGQNIGAVGSTGYAFGAHLHFEIRIWGNPVNPLNYM